jgi:hypothetical protein
MKVYLDDIKRIDWLNSILEQSEYGKSFLACKSPFYFVFYYNYIEEESLFDIKKVSKIYEINDNIYRGQGVSRTEYTGYLKEPFDTQSFLFFALLKSLNKDITQEDKEKIDDLFLYYKSQDMKSLSLKERLKIKYSYGIDGRSSFRDSISSFLYLTPKLTDGFCLIGDLLDNSFKNKKGISFYGSVLNEMVVSLPNPDGGLIPQQNGAMRYMIVGEKKFKNDKLSVAKELLRAGASENEILLETGWFFNKYDKKWRFKIPSNKLSYKKDALTEIDYDGKKYLVCIPEKFKENIGGLIELLLELNYSDADVIAVRDAILRGYDVTIGDIFDFDELYEIYPELKSRICFFLINKSVRHSCFFNKQGLSFLSLMSPYYTKERMLTVAAHEMQHYIQSVEGFGNGGNEFFAQLIISIGGEAFRKYYEDLSCFMTAFSQKASLVSTEKYRKLTVDIMSIDEDGLKIIDINGKLVKIPVDQSKKVKMCGTIQAAVVDSKTISETAEGIAFIFINIYISFEKSRDLIGQFIKENFGISYKDLFDNMVTFTEKSLIKNDYLKSKGWDDLDINLLSFRAYQYLSGELESRYVQETTKINEDLSQYFSFYTSESANPSEITAYGHEPIFGHGVKAQYGIEKTDENKYIIHSAIKAGNIPFMLHEIGHIIYDAVYDENKEQIDSSKFASNYLTSEEYFCESFVDFIARREFSKELSEHIIGRVGNRNFNEFDSIFDNFFQIKEKSIDGNKLSEMLEFVNLILQNI